MVETAELRALTGESAGLDRLERELIEHARQGVAREVEGLDVEAVDDVSRGQVDVNVGVDRDHHRRVLGRLTDHDGLGTGVGELPTPLERVHVDGDVANVTVDVNAFQWG